VAKASVDYERHGVTYALHRQPDPRIASAIWAALGTARTVVNVGAGAGSYEPPDRQVLAVEPSSTMRAQRPASAAPVISARAEALPFRDGSFDAAMASVTVHHWDPPEAGLRELRRVARGPVVVFTFDLAHLPSWQQEYLHEALVIEEPRFPPIERIADVLGGRVRIEHLPTPGDCCDGFFEAYWRRPEAALDPAVRAGQSLWALLSEGVEQRIVDRLARDLESGEWDRKYGYLRSMDSFDGALRLLISEPTGRSRGGEPEG
jgi:SAM-dependent methyltransferase